MFFTKRLKENIRYVFSNGSMIWRALPQSSQNRTVLHGWLFVLHLTLGQVSHLGQVHHQPARGSVIFTTSPSNESCCVLTSGGDALGLKEKSCDFCLF